MSGTQIRPCEYHDASEAHANPTCRGCWQDSSCCQWGECSDPATVRVWRERDDHVMRVCADCARYAALIGYREGVERRNRRWVPQLRRFVVDVPLPTSHGETGDPR